MPPDSGVLMWSPITCPVGSDAGDCEERDTRLSIRADLRIRLHQHLSCLPSQLT